MVMFVSAADVRTYMAVDKTTKEFATPLIEKNIAAASALLQRATGRRFEAATAGTTTVTTNGSRRVEIPDHRLVTSATLSGTLLVAGTDYSAVTDVTGLITSLVLRYANTHASGWYPGDLVIVGDSGYSPYPDELIDATTILAAYKTLRPKSLLAGVAFTPDGTVLNYRALPSEVVDFIQAWDRHPVVIG